MSKITEYVLGAMAALFIVAWQGLALGSSLEGASGTTVAVHFSYHHEHPGETRKG